MTKELVEGMLNNEQGGCKVVLTVAMKINCKVTSVNLYAAEMILSDVASVCHPFFGLSS